MKRKKTRSVASYRAASLKGARTRKRMKMQWASPLDKYEDMQVGLINLLRPKTIHGHIPLNTKRYLPNPWFDMVRK